MAMRDPIPRKWTIDEWLAYEEETHTRYEYIDGDIYAMSGGTATHSRIIMNLTQALGRLINWSTCELFPADMRVHINDEKYLYADLSAVCGTAQFQDDKETMLLNPLLVIEVTSPSSTAYDLGIKAEFYQQIDSLKAYLVIDQDRYHARLFIRQNNTWLVEDIYQKDADIPLNSLNCTLSMQDIYRNISL